MEFDLSLLGDHFIRLTIAGLAGGALGFDRELSGQSAGLRTHMVVAIGSALFTMLGEQFADGDPNATTRVISGVASGVGFLGAGAILKLGDREQVKGLTTASSIWLAAGLGAIAGLGRYELMTAGTVMAIAILVLLKPLGHRLSPEEPEDNEKHGDKSAD